MNNNRVEVLSNVVEVGGKFRTSIQIRYVHDTVIQKVVDVTGEDFETREEASEHKSVLEKAVMRTLSKVQKTIPNSKLFKHEFEK